MNMEQTLGPRSIRLGDQAPDFQARSTIGDIRLSQYRGRWLILFSHPADFTPVCSTEFVALARRAAEFEALDCALPGLSVDGLYAHLGWVRALREAFDVTVPFPLLEDPGMAIGRAYGMIDDSSTDSVAMRMTCFIDPDGIVRATTCYPHNVGRTVEEMLRLLKGLQMASRHNVLIPEGWREREKVLAPIAETSSAAPDGKDWFCRRIDAP